MDQAKQSDPTTEKWAGTLRRRDPDIQPTLPSIIARKTSSTSSVGSGRKCRSVDRAPRHRVRQLAPIKPTVRKTDVPTEGDVALLERDEKVFDATGYELHLVETLERDILQKNPDVRWKDVIGLEDAKSVLQEAMVLPLVMPDYFKVND
jgi:katanin p60 ATPase-containing subunit A1